LNDFTGNSTELAGTRVLVNGALVPVLSAGKAKASFQCPSGLPGDPLHVVVETPSGITEAVNATMRFASPALLTDENSTQGMIFHSETTELSTVRDVRNAGRPAQPGDLLTIRATGLGTGLPVFVKIGDAYAQVQSISRSADSAGVWDVRVIVPSGVELGDAVPVRIELASPNGLQLDSNVVTIAIESVRP
jgi:uncharacterized protein (TIGR03437 family)